MITAHRTDVSWLGRVLSSAFLCLALCGVPSPDGARADYPTACKPYPGGTFECSGFIESPYSYLPATCGSNPFKQSAAQAHAVWEAMYLPGITACPGHVYNHVGWVSSPMCANGNCGAGIPQFSTYCGGSPLLYPQLHPAGNETNNWLLYQIGGYQNPPTCSVYQTPSLFGTVRRDRTVYCPRGYYPASTYCWRASVDVAKNLGRCKDCQGKVGNPINVTIGNKYQEEVDYVGSGDFPLRFARFYNSWLRRDDRDADHYGFTAWFDTFGNGAFHATATNQVETPFWMNVGLDAIGANWRHSYQRTIRFMQASADAVSTAFAYRPDGRVFPFNLYGGAFHAHADVSDRLTRLTDGSGNTTGWRYVSADGDEVENYDAIGRLTSIQNRAGQSHLLAYDALGRLATVTDQFGHGLTFSYAAVASDPAAVNRIASVTTPSGGVYSYAYDASDRLISVTYPGSHVRQYLYENGTFVRALTGILDENNQRMATWGYDSEGRANLSEHAGGASRVTIAYTKTGEYGPPEGLWKAVVTDSLSVARTYDLTYVLGSNRVTNVTQPAASGVGTKSAATSHDANGNINSRFDFNGRETRYVFDLSRNLETSRTEAYGTAKARTTTTQWHATFRLPTQIDEPNRRTTFTHDTNGNVLTRTVTDLSVTPNVARTWTYTYNSLGQVLTENGPRTDVTDVTTYTYYSCSTGYQCGQVETITNAAGHITTYNTYNAHGQPLTITDPNGLLTTLTYDGRQRLTSRSAGGETTTLEYWPTGLLKKVTLPDTSFLLYTYDNAHRLTRIDDSEGDHIVYTLDAMGNRTKEESFDPSNYLVRLHHRAFNSLNRLWKEIGAANTAAVTTTFGYDDNGNQTSANAPLSRNSSSLYDELNRLKQITDPASGVTQFGYDANDNLTSVTDPRGKVTSYLYNAFGEIKEQTSPDTGVTGHTYDEAGNLNTSTDARSKTGTHSYDELNRLTQIAYADQTIGYSYDTGTNNKGRLMQVTDGSGSTSFTYTSLGRVASRTQVMGSVSKTLGYGYNSAGQLTTFTTPSGQTITYSYAHNRIASVTVNSTTLASNVLYDPFGPVRQWDWGNGTLAVRTFDQDGNLDQIDSAGLRTYAQDDAFRITGITDAVNSSLSWTLGYDTNDRLTSASKTGQSQSFTYDANGNRLTQGGSTSSTFTISSTSNRLASVSGALSRTYGYDAAGNTTSFSSFSFGYNDAGRLTSVSGSASASYAHNALGQRVKKTVSGVSTYFVYDEAGHLIGEYDGSGALIQETVWLEEIPIATLRPNGGSVSIFYVHTDHLNTPRRISRPSGNVIVWRWDSDPFGTDAVNSDPDGDSTLFAYSLRFPGQYFDAETGLSYNDFRDYDPATGGYVESDPVGLAGGLNTFAYVAGNPVSWIDPYGLDWMEYSGQQVTLYDGNFGDRSKRLLSCAATSGYADAVFNYQFVRFQNKHDVGPVPESRYRINLAPNPARHATMHRSGDNLNSGIGIQLIRPSYSMPDGSLRDPSAWGTWRARLEHVSGETFGRRNFYLHNSHKGYTHGCVESCDELLQELLRYRAEGNHYIDFNIRYTTQSTRGRTFRP